MGLILSTHQRHNLQTDQAADTTAVTSVPFPTSLPPAATMWGEAAKSAALPLITEDNQLQHNMCVAGLYCIHVCSHVNELQPS